MHRRNNPTVLSNIHQALLFFLFDFYKWYGINAGNIVHFTVRKLNIKFAARKNFAKECQTKPLMARSNLTSALYIFPNPHSN